MKKILCLLVVLSLLVVLLPGCQTVTKEFGGSTTITLEPNLKLEEITWKEDSLWYLTRPMREDEQAETHTFQQQSNFGILEGTVTIIETKEKAKEE